MSDYQILRTREVCRGDGLMIVEDGWNTKEVTCTGCSGSGKVLVGTIEDLADAIADIQNKLADIKERLDEM